jgi:hypothetical protein
MVAGGLWAAPAIGFAQGCVPARYISLSLGAQGIAYLEPGQWEGDLGYRYLHSENVYMGTQEQPQLHDVGGRLTANSFDLTASYGISHRFSASLTMPFVANQYSLINDDLQRHTGSSGGLGDVRLLANAWIFNPVDHPNGNINLGVGPKFPTGDYKATDLYYYSNAPPNYRPVDIAAQPGDGGWGVFLEFQAYQKLVRNLFGYVSGFYLINPEDTNGTGRPSPSVPIVNSIPDQYFGRAGLSYAIWPAQGLSISLGARIDGIPTKDLIGDSNGFRRAGYAIYIDPGINWAFGKNTLSVNVPVAVERNLQATQYSKAGGLADFIVVAGFSRRF